ncbi:IS3 family transposase [Anaerococcus lactolyticus]|uniref:IS3 family transposase n=1 Tax=Anaerococcus lactolyticus TaxID=33032 RepID=UPI0009E07337
MKIYLNQYLNMYNSEILCYEILKQEIYYGHKFYSYEHLKQTIEDFIKYYNEERTKKYQS